MSFLGTVAIAFPLFGAIFAVIWSILYDYDASVRTACHVSALSDELEKVQKRAARFVTLAPD